MPGEGVEQEILDSFTGNEIELFDPRLDWDLTSAIVDGTIEESMIGATDLKLTVTDVDLRAFRLGVYEHKFRLAVEGIVFQLTEISVVDTDTLQLTFELWLIAEMREHTKPMRATRSTTTRAQFIHRQLRELKQAFVLICPDLDRTIPTEAPTSEEISGAVQTLEKTEESGRQPHVSHHALTVKGAKMTKEQGTILSEALNAASTSGAPKLAAEALVVALIWENTVGRSNPGSPGDRGPLSIIDSTVQGIRGTGSASGGASFDPYNTQQVSTYFLAHGFFGQGGASALARANPHAAPSDIGSKVQGPAVPYSTKWDGEAHAIVVDYEGGAGGFTEAPTAEPATETAQYEFSRGKPGEREDTYTCCMRLAEEVLWRFFVVGRVRSKPAVYFIDDNKLLRSRPRYLITPESLGIKKVTFDIELGHRLVTMRGRKVPKPSEAQIDVLMQRWEAPPGTVVELADYGNANGRWLVDSIQRSFYDPTGTIHLRAPQTALPEPRSTPTPKPEATAGPKAQATAGEKKKLAQEHPEILSGIRNVVATVLTHFPKLVITATTNGNHVSNSYHYLKRAVDLGTSPYDQSYMDKAAEWIAQNLESVLTEGIHNPGLAVKDGKHVDGPTFYSSVWAGHVDHIHLAV